MRSTKRTLMISGGLAAGGLMLALIGIWIFEREGESWGSGLLLAAGFGVGPAALIFFISSAVSGLRKEQLESGDGEIARWRVSATEWAAFRDQEKRFLAAGRPPSIHNLREGAPKDGDVIFAAKAVIADEDYHDLIRGGLDDLQGVKWVEGRPSCLEFHWKTRRSGASGGFSFTHTHLRVPIAADESRQATKVFARFTKATSRRGVALAMINPKLTIRICLGLSVACVLAAVWGFANREATHLAEAPVVAAVVGVVLGLGALLTAGIVVYRLHVLKT